MPSLKELNTQSWDDRLEARAHTYKLAGRFHFACKRLAVRQPKEWLDIGTGNGFLPTVARPLLNGVRITGTDFADNALETATPALDVRVTHDIDRADLPFDDGAFDFVTCLEVLEHLIFPDHALKKFHRVLKPGGHLVVTVPNLQFAESLLQLARGKMPGIAADPRHMSVFTHRFLKRLLGEAGFRVTVPAGCDASPAWFAKVSPKYLARTIAVEAEKM